MHVANYEEITLEIERKGRLVTYKAPGEVTETGLKAKFGDLGLIDVTFEPTRTRTDEPPKGCKGRPSALSEGLFVGTIEFTGEREYVRIDATQAKGELNVWRESEWHCHRHRGVAHPQVIPPRPALRPRSQSKVKNEPATLAAASRRCQCFFAAFAEPGRKKRRSTVFVGAQFEEREGMEISRVTSAKAGAAAFAFNHTAGTATVHPPLPFTGNGTFKRRPHGRDLWRSTIQVPLLGANPLRVGDPGFKASLARELPGGE
ncbi:MAG TPA: hypothetical protein VFJ64_04875 [Solirubrobacterales bacterium]|nr:hypothetical protein [Solirubrobacterales bacterium]